MKFVILIAIGTIFTAYGFSSGANLPHNVGYIIGWVGATISIGAAYFQYKYSQPYEHFFNDADWNHNGEFYEISIPNKAHKKGAGATSTIYKKNEGWYEEITCDNYLQADKSVLIKALLKFDGKLTIK